MPPALRQRLVATTPERSYRYQSLIGDNEGMRWVARYLRRGWISCLGLAALHAASPPDAPGLPNFHRVDENIYRGAQPRGEGFTSLAKLGIKTVIDLRGEHSEENAVQSAGMRYIRLPWREFKAPTDSQIADVLALLGDSSTWPVFVHCRRGADRTGTAIACYRIAHDHWPNQVALTEAKSFGLSPLEVAMQRYILRFVAPAL
jgi:tyrosine-protein phosphatase SIW14